MLSINTSIASLNATRKLTQTGRVLQTSFERLSSGKRINGADDDAAGLNISTRMDSKLKQSSQLIRNANDTASLAQTASGMLREQINNIQRMRELTVQAMNDTNQDADRRSIQNEITQLKAEVSKIAEGTFNGKRIFGNELDFQLSGPEGAGNLNITSQKTNADRLGRHSLKTSKVGVSQDKLEDDDITLSTLDGGTVTLRGSLASDDLISYTNNDSSAIAKAAVINSYTKQTGVEALVEHTVFLGGTEIQAVTLDAGNYFEINGVAIAGFRVDSQDADGALVDAINAVEAETGVIATTTIDGALKLTAKDGRNIAVNAVGDASLLGLGQSVTSARLTLRSRETYEVQYKDITIDEKLGLLFDNRIKLFSGSASTTLAGADAGTAGWAFLGDPSATNYDFDNVTLTGRYNGANAAGDHNFNFEIDLSNGGVYLGILDNDPDGNGNYGVNSYIGITDADIVTVGSGVYYFATAAALTNDLAPLGITNDPTNRIFTTGGLDPSYGNTFFKFSLVNANTADPYDVGAGAPPGTVDTDGVDSVRFVAPIGDLNQLDNLVGVGFDHQLDTISVLNQYSAERALFTIDAAIEELSEAESMYGAILNRLDSTTASLEQERLSLSGSKSQIVDADFAAESAALTQNSIIQQAGVSVLAQANASSSIVLELL